MGSRLYIELVAELIFNKFNELYGTKIKLVSIVTRKTQGEQEQNAIRVFSAVDNSFIFNEYLCDTLYIKNALGSIFIRITHLFRFLYQSPGSGHVNDQSPPPPRPMTS